jgi:serine/threonine protein phosphatase PrpC
MNCTACTEPLDTGAAFCEACGTATGLAQPVAVVPPPAGSLCLDGAPHSYVDGYCAECGHPQPHDEPADVTADGTLALATHRGHHHPDNQDAGGFRRYADDRMALVVCDGVSTAYTSRLAADTAVTVVLDAAPGEDDIGASLRTAIEAAHAAICQLPYDENQNLAEPQATIVAAVVSAGKAHIAWVGDSRGYLIAGGAVRQLTRDDSWLNDQIEHGASYETALHDPNAHCITQCLGMRDDTPVVNLVTTDLPADGWLLLCSDGLWNYAPEADDLAAAFPPQGSPAERGVSLVEFANRHGGIDNVTVVLLQLG